VLNLVLSRGWKDYGNFSSELSCHIIRTEPRSRNELVDVIKSFQSPFYTLNKISVDSFIEIFPIQETLNLLSKYHETEPLTFADVFQETVTVSIDEGKNCVPRLASLPEDKIQETLVDSLREKNATNCRGRAKDTVLEVADLEHFSVNVNGIPTTFAAVVKGYKSVSGKTVTWENIAHQVTKAYRTRPDHILLVLAKNPADSVTSELVQYSKSIGNQNLIVMCDPLELARFLKARHLLQ
jgi:hypothetical protein